MKVYVGTWAKYNSGSLYGKWFDLDDYTSYDDFIDDALEYHKDEEDPELDFQDYELEDDFDKLFEEHTREYIDAKEEIERCHEDRGLVATIANHLSWSARETADNIKYLGDYASYYSSLEEYFYDEAANCPDNLRNFIDWKAYAEWLCVDYEVYKDGFLVYSN